MLSLVALTSLGGTLFVTIGQFSQWSEEAPAFLENYDLPVPEGHDITTAELEAIAEHNHWLVISSDFLRLFAHVSSGLLLGLTMAAMLLGHWYLNSPTMDLIPLRRLIIAMGLALLLQFVLSAWGLWGEFSYAEQLSTQWMLFVLLRWTFGLVGVAAMTWMAWQTLKVPNTQSATGILYVAVIGTFVGETMALLLSTESLFPL
ncbi:MAG: hypothetical protein GXP24_10025 [Planctomycetes bacterium]|nr:hypothetical protein [Planctomycetota bacterium]